jgi:hypothetical protein
VTQLADHAHFGDIDAVAERLLQSLRENLA